MIETWYDANSQEKSRFIEICPIWISDKWNMMINIPNGMTISGKMIVMPVKEKEPEDIPFWQ
jgi:hypothetical protein